MEESLQVGSEKEDGYYYYDEEGRLQVSKGIKIGDYWYYLSSSGRRLQEEFRQKGEDWFYYDGEGHLVKDLDIVINGYRYIFQSNGAAYRGLKEENGKIIRGLIRREDRHLMQVLKIKMDHGITLMIPGI